MYATIKANGKKIRLKMKKPKKLWPLRSATRAGQKAMAIQITAKISQLMVETARTRFIFLQARVGENCR